MEQEDRTRATERGKREKNQSAQEPIELAKFEMMMKTTEIMGGESKSFASHSSPSQYCVTIDGGALRAEEEASECELWSFNTDLCAALHGNFAHFSKKYMSL